MKRFFQVLIPVMMLLLLAACPAPEAEKPGPEQEKPAPVEPTPEPKPEPEPEPKTPDVFISNTDLHVDGGEAYLVTAYPLGGGKGPDKEGDESVYQQGFALEKGKELTLVPGLGEFLKKHREIKVETVNTGKGGLPRLQPFHENTLRLQPGTDRYILDNSNRILRNVPVKIYLERPAKEPEYGKLAGFVIQADSISESGKHCAFPEGGNRVLVKELELFPGTYGFKAMAMLRNSKSSTGSPYLEAPASRYMDGTFTVPGGGGDVVLPLDDLRYYAELTVTPNPDWNFDRICVSCENNQKSDRIVLIDQQRSARLLMDPGTDTVKVQGEKYIRDTHYKVHSREMTFESGKKYEWNPDMIEQREQNISYKDIGLQLIGNMDDLQNISVTANIVGKSTTEEKVFQRYNTWESGMMIELWNVPGYDWQFYVKATFSNGCKESEYLKLGMNDRIVYDLDTNKITGMVIR